MAKKPRSDEMIPCDLGGHRPSWIGSHGVRECDTCIAFTIDSPEGTEIRMKNIYASDAESKLIKLIPKEKQVEQFT